MMEVVAYKHIGAGVNIRCENSAADVIEVLIFMWPFSDARLI